MIHVSYSRRHTDEANINCHPNNAIPNSGTLVSYSTQKGFFSRINWKIAILFISIFAVMLFFNVSTPIISDDFNYCYEFGSGLRNRTIADIYRSMSVHRRAFHGRVIANGLASFFLMYPKGIFNIVNPLVTVLIGFVSYRIFSLYAETSKKAVLPTVFFLLILWNFTPEFGQTFLWLDGSCNYSWTVAFLFIFLAPFFAGYSDKDVRLHPIAAFFLLLEAVVAGAYSESGSVAAIFIAGCLLLSIFIRSRKLPLLLVLNFMAACAGFIWLMSAPKVKGNLSGSSILGLFNTVLGLISSMIARLGSVLFYSLLGVFIAVLLVLFLVRRRKKIFFCLLYFILVCGFCVLFLLTVLPALLKADSFLGVLYIFVTSPAGNVLLSCLLYFSLMLASLYFRVNARLIWLALILFTAGVGSAVAFLFANYFPARGLLYFTVYTALACGLLVQALSEQGHFRLTRLFTTVLLAAFVVFFSLGAADIVSLRSQAMERMQIIETAQAEGIGDIYLPMYTFNTKYCAQHGLIDVRSDGDYPNDYMADYYGLNSIIGVEPST